MKFLKNCYLLFDPFPDESDIIVYNPIKTLITISNATNAHPYFLHTQKTDLRIRAIKKFNYIYCNEYASVITQNID
jgi:hypothetical protein